MSDRSVTDEMVTSQGSPGMLAFFLRVQVHARHFHVCGVPRSQSRWPQAEHPSVELGRACSLPLDWYPMFLRQCSYLFLAGDPLQLLPVTPGGVCVQVPL